MRNIIINLALLRMTTINVDAYYMPISMYNQLCEFRLFIQGDDSALTFKNDS